MKRSDSTTREDADEHFVHGDPIADEALDWFVRLQGSERSEELLTKFSEWHSRDPRHASEFNALEEIWGSKAFENAVSGLKLATIQVPVNAPSRSRRWALRGAAAAACLTVAVGAWQGPALMVAWQADYITSTGAQSVVTLPDGSNMHLNTETAVSIDFDQGRRNVRLIKGEAFFDVIHDDAKPFHVAGDYGDVEVKGTAFSVRNDDGETTVVLERGLVDVTCRCKPGGEAQLRPGQTVTASADALSPVETINAGRALAWRNGRLSFDEAELGQVVLELSRYYRGRVFVADSRIKQLVVSGNYRLDDIEGAMRTLADAANVGMTRLPGGIIILR